MKRLLLGALLGALLFVLGQVAPPARAVTLECPPSLEAGQTLVCTVRVTGLPAGMSTVKTVIYPADKAKTYSRQTRVTVKAPPPPQPATAPVPVARYYSIAPAGSFSQPEPRGLRLRPWAGPGGTHLLEAFDYNRGPLLLDLREPVQIAWRGRTLNLGPGLSLLCEDGRVVTPADPFTDECRSSEPTALWEGQSLTIAKPGGGGWPRPAVPEGKEPPEPNRPCPAWVHERHADTWHPQIDPVYWCYFGHEHGSRPPAEVRLEYDRISRAAGMDEPHAGFKGFHIRDVPGVPDYELYVLMHIGTTGLRRACVQHHTVEVWWVRKGGRTVAAHLGGMADFGPSVSNVTDEPLVLAACPDQFRRAGGRTDQGLRKLPTVSIEGAFYEPWRASGLHATGLRLASLTANTQNPITACDFPSPCNLVRGNTDEQANGNARILSWEPGFGVTARAAVGEFWTDPMGHAVVAAGTPGAVRQYLEPGLSISATKVPPSMHCVAKDPWDMAYACVPNTGDDATSNYDLERSIDISN